jgi:hypothetical protein
LGGEGRRGTTNPSLVSTRLLLSSLREKKKKKENPRIILILILFSRIKVQSERKREQG